MRTKQCLTSSDVKKVLAACEAEAAKNKWAVSVSIVDDGGFLLGFLRMDGATPITAEVSMGKARTSAMTKRPSKFFEDRVKERPAFAGFPAGILIQGGHSADARERMRGRDRRFGRAIARRRTGCGSRGERPRLDTPIDQLLVAVNPQPAGVTSE